MARQLARGPGGKGLNQAIAAARAGADVSMIGAVGRDAEGDALLAALAAAGVRTDAVRRVAPPTGTAVVTVGPDGDNAISVVTGANDALRELSPMETGLLQRAATVLLQLEVPLGFVTSAVGRSRGSRVTALGDVDPRAPSAPPPGRRVSVEKSRCRSA